MPDIEILKDQVNALAQKNRELRKKETAFLRLQGIGEEIEKASGDRESLQKALKEAEEEKKTLLKKKKDAVSESLQKIMDRMNEVLPIGEAFLVYEDKSVFIGWKTGERITPYNGLSGGEKQIFDTAIAHILNANILVLEAAELDNQHIAAALEDLEKASTQVIVNTCHTPPHVPESFVVVSTDEVRAC